MPLSTEMHEWAEGAFHVNGTYHARLGDADRERHRLATRTANIVARARAWIGRGARVDGVEIRPALGSVPALDERCLWCGFTFEPGAPAIAVADRHMHDRVCREEFDRALADAELARAETTYRMLEA